jgi:LysR family transcriptional regulator, pca operon transcriptional activator
VPDGFQREALWTEPISIIARAGHPLFAEERMSVNALGRYNLVLPTLTQRVGQEIENLLSALGLGSTTSLRSSSYGFIREMLYGTDLISMMPRLLMVGDLMRGTLRIVPLPIAASNRPAGLILPRMRALPAAGRAFVSCLRAYVAELAELGIAPPITSAHSEAERSDTTGLKGAD